MSNLIYNVTNLYEETYKADYILQKKLFNSFFILENHIFSR